MKVRKWLCIVLALLLLTAAGCAANSAATDSMVYENMEMETQAANGSLTDNGSIDSQPPSESRKWIITMDISAETEDLDAFLAQLDARISELNGYVEGRNIYNGSAYSGYRRYRNASLTVRIPAQQVDLFTQQIGEASNVVYSNKNLTDVTLNYVAVESRMNALQAEEVRLLELMEQAETMSDLLEIESRLTDVRYELESVTSQLRVYDNQVDYATVYLDVSEVQEYTVVEEQTVWQRIGTGFVSSVKGVGKMLLEIAVFLITKLPYILLLSIVAVVAVRIIRKKRKKKAE